MDKVSLSLEGTKFKLIERSRGRMKIQIKFSKEEAEGFKNFCKLKPPELEEEIFYKQIFYAGCNAMTDQIKELIDSHKASREESVDDSPKDSEPMTSEGKDLVSEDGNQQDEQTEE
mgnify:CR=1 FL=1|tara:strand:+ start:6065 stop:6412 length:348 start_codon:yes stop_codon:yes gene_type:complete